MVDLMTVDFVWDYPDEHISGRARHSVHAVVCLPTHSVGSGWPVLPHCLRTT